MIWPQKYVNLKAVSKEQIRCYSRLLCHYRTIPMLSTRHAGLSLLAWLELTVSLVY